MAEKIELQIVADNADYIQKTKQVEQATISMQTTSEQSQKHQKDLITQTANEYKKVVIEKKKAFDTKPIDEHNKKTAAAADALQNVGGAAGAAGGKVKSLSTAFKALLANPIALAITAIIGALTGLVKLIKSTDSGANQLAARFAQIKAILDVVRQRVLDFGGAIGNLFKGNFKAAAEGIKNSFSGMGDQMRIATGAAYDYVMALDAIEDAEKNYVSTSAENRNKIAKLEFTAQDRRKSTDERKKALQEALQLGTQEVEAQKEFARQRLDAGLVALAGQNRVTEQELLSFVKMTDAERANADKALKDLYNRNEEKVNNLDQMYATWIDLDTRYYEENKRNMGRLSGFEEEMNRDANEKKKKIDEERLKNQKEFLDASLKLEDEYSKAIIGGLSGTEKIKAEEAYQLKQIQLLEDHLKTIGTLTEDHYKWLDGLRATAALNARRAIVVEQQAEAEGWSDFYDEATDQRMKFYDFREELDLKTAEIAGELSGQKELEIQRKWLAARLDLLKASKDPELQARAEIMEADLALLDQKIAGMDSGNKLAKALGLSDEDLQTLSDNAKIAVDNVVGMLDEMFTKRVEDAQRIRELLDNQIDDTQAALDAEVELAKLGFANNVNAKKKELEELKKAREKAIKEEEKALKRQQQLEAASQLSSLLAATAQIIFQYSKVGPVIGQVMAVAAIAAMWATFAAARIQASKATKLAEGAVGTETGIISGKRHSEGGEHFLNHVEVERGEMWGVLNRSASQKYGKQFNQVVTSFNKDKMPIMQPLTENNILVDVNQTNERLDKVENQLIKLNKHFSNTKEVSETTSVRIERTGNKTRIIRK